MNPISAVKLAGAVGLVVLLLVGCWKVQAWREAAADRDRIQGEYSAYRTTIQKQIAEKDRQKRINDEISAGYVGVIQKQGADLADAHTRLAGVRVRVGACPRAVPAAAPAAEPSAGAPEEGADRQPFVVDALGVADRLAACDAAGARLNALIDWHDRQSAGHDLDVDELVRTPAFLRMLGALR